MKKWFLLIDVEKCENCENCFLSCKDEHADNDWPKYTAPQPSQGQSWIQIQTKERGKYPFIDVAYLPTTCMHCDNPSCITAAKNGAIHQRPDGIIIIDPVKSKGQKNLVDSCPYGAIKWNDQLQLPQKCTLCAHLLDEGWKETRCTQSCPTAALTLRHVDETEMHQIIEDEKLRPYMPEHKTRPRVYYKNLYRFTHCFIAGSVAVRVDGKEECAKGAKVTLLNSVNETISEITTDDFGDFKFDNLEENGGKYKLQIAYAGYDVKTITVELTKSLAVGTIFL